MQKTLHLICPMLIKQHLHQLEIWFTPFCSKGRKGEMAKLDIRYKK